MSNKRFLIVDLKKRGYRWNTVKSKNGEIPLEEAPDSQVFALLQQQKRKNKTKLLKKIRKQKNAQMTFDFMEAT